MANAKALTTFELSKFMVRIIYTVMKLTNPSENTSFRSFQDYKLFKFQIFAFVELIVEYLPVLSRGGIRSSSSPKREI